METATSSDSGLLASARRAGSSVLGLLQTRLEILGVELQEEKLRAINLLVSLAVAAGLAVAGLFLAIGTLALFLWRQFGYAGLVGLAVATLAAAAVLLWLIRRRIRTAPGPFATTIAEIRKDVQCLQARN